MGPFAIHNKKRLKLGGMHITDSGVFERCEQFGPPCYETWAKAYKVLHSCLVMCDAVLPSQLDAYAAMIKGYSDDFGAKCWPTIYQADVRCRQERMQALRRKIVLLHNDSPNLAAAQGFDQLYPWRFVWKAAVDDQQFWFKAVQQKCLLFVSGAIGGSHMIDGDVLVGGFDNGGSRSSGSGGPPPQPPPRRDGASRDHSPPRKKRKAQRTHHEVDTASNLLKTSRSGVPLCQAFQRGECKTGALQGICPLNGTFSHQCARCLDTRHGAHHPRACENNLAKDKRGGKSKGKGKGGRAR